MSSIFAGQSGCLVQLVAPGIVRKTSSTKQYNDRLKIQAQKQESLTFPNFKSTSIFKKNFNDQGLYFFEMAFIPGKTLANAFSEISLIEIIHLTEVFADTFRPEVQKFEVEVFSNKLEQIQKNISRAQRVNIEGPITLLEQFDWKVDSNINCHGDLSFENIIYYEKKLYLIDFLDSFCDSWMIDFAKILQDVEVFWAFRNHSMTLNDQIKFETFRVNLIKKCMNKGMSFEQFKNCYYLLILNLMRILPYARDTRTVSFLCTAIHKLEFKILNYLEQEYEDFNNTMCR